MVYKWLNTIQFLLFPTVCRLCGDAGHARLDLCPGCLGDLPAITSPCLGCAIPLPPEAGALCGHCQQRAPDFDYCTAAYRYAAPLDYLVQRLKFNNDLAMGQLLGRLLLNCLQSQAVDRPDVLLPVPLHRVRLRERGFNQATEIARVLAREWGIPIERRLAKRVRATETQSLLPARERRKNLRNAFVACEGKMPQHVAIVDDVMTTGSTVNELARCLKRAGVRRVDVWVVARAGGARKD